jgi:hypothetical protein
MRYWLLVPLWILTSFSTASAKVVVFWQEDFPTVESQAIAQSTLRSALGEMQPQFAGVDALRSPATLADADLLVLPYGSAFPADCWEAIHAYLQGGGNLLNLGGRPLVVPVVSEQGKFVQRSPRNAYSRALGIWHTYEVPQKDAVRFAWRDEFSFFSTRELKARRVFVTGMWWGGGETLGMGFLLNARDERVAAPVVREDFRALRGGERSGYRGARCVMLNFEPQPGYWSTPDGVSLVREGAEYARQGANLLWVEMQNATLAPGEIPQLVLHVVNLRRQQMGQPTEGRVRLELISGEQVLETAEVVVSGDSVAAPVQFAKALPPGLYGVRATLEVEGKVHEVYQTGFWSRDEKLLRTGPKLDVGHTYFRKDGAPFLPFGTNYFTTDIYPGSFGFQSSSNAYVWERDFAEMERDGVTFVRTGVWNNHADLLDKVAGGVRERVLRNLEAFLLSANRHHIQVHFTFFAFDPQTIRRSPGEESFQRGPGSNPYTDAVARRAQKDYVSCIVGRFKDLPYLSWDLINEPSFSNPKHLWHGNTPNADPTEIAAWNDWLKRRYGEVAKLAAAWGVTPEELGNFGGIPLPDPEDLTFSRYGNSRHVRAVDYNLFAQDAFNAWAADMIAAIRSTGSTQLVTVGQDEGGVADRLLNQFYGSSGVAFTVNHTWWRDDALLWDSVAAKRPDIPNLIGETGIQPVWRMDSTWRWDEINGLPLFERKLALGFAAGNTGALQWDWSESDSFGIKRADGSRKLWQGVLSGMAKFAQQASPHLSEQRLPEVAVVLPQSLQLSVFNSTALEAQQQCVRALYQQARASAYVVGEYQIEMLGDPRLIILPSPWVLEGKAWEAILAKVRDGATLLVSGRFDADPHFHPTNRQKEAGIDYEPGLLATRENSVDWPGGQSRLTYSGDKTTYMERGFLASGETFAEKEVGEGRILYFALPLELSDDEAVIGKVYRFALQRAGVAPVYSTDCSDPGILICPTAMQAATLYVLTSESSAEQTVAFRDAASGKEVRVTLAPGRAALRLVSHEGEVLASYGGNGGQ